MTISLELKLNEEIDVMIRKLEAAKRESNSLRKIASVRKAGQGMEDWYIYWDEKLMDWMTD